MGLFLSGGQKVSLKVIVVDREIPVALPEEDSFARLHWFWLNEAHVYEHLDALLDHFFVDCISSTVFLDLVQNCCSDFNLPLGENSLLEHRHALFAHELQLVVFKVIAIKVLKTTVHHFGVDDVGLPGGDEITQKRLSALALEQRDHFMLEVFLDKLLKDLVYLLVIIVGIALIDN